MIEHLTRVKGVGVWTVHMFLIFALRRPDVLPTGDLGVRAAIKKAYGLAELPKPDEMERIAASWRPYCSVASWYLWRSLENTERCRLWRTHSCVPCRDSSRHLRLRRHRRRQEWRRGTLKRAPQLPPDPIDEAL